MISVIAYIAVGIFIGLIIGWLIAINRASAKIQAADAKAISFESITNELRTQLKQIADEKSKLEKEISEAIQAKVKAETELKNAVERIAEEKKLLDEAAQHLTDVFKAIANDTLSTSTRTLVELAKENFTKILTEVKGDFGKSQQAIHGLIEPLAKSLQQFDSYLKAVEKNREGAYADLKRYLDSLNEAQRDLKKETSSLTTALRATSVKGKWGELTLKRVVELTGMAEHCDFIEQSQTQNGERGNIQRPDMIINLPEDRIIVVDAKVSMDAYLQAIEETDDKKRKEALEKHANQIRKQIKDLSTKEYPKQFNNKTPDFTIMFIPIEASFSSALQYDQNLFEDAIKERIVIASPITLVALLQAIAFSWRQANAIKEVQNIIDTARLLYERTGKVLEYVANLGAGLERAVVSYNETVGSIESRMLPTLQKFKEYGIVSQKDQTKIPNQIEKLVRSFDKQLDKNL